MKVKICPICDREMGAGKICPNCKSYVKKPKYFEKQSFYSTPSAMPGECDCEIHMPDMPRIEKKDITGRSFENDYREAYEDDYASRAGTGNQKKGGKSGGYGADVRKDSEFGTSKSSENGSGKINGLPYLLRVILVIVILQVVIPVITMLIRMFTGLF